MPIDRSKLQSMHKLMVENGYTQDYATFEKGFAGKDHYANRKRVYDLFTENGADLGGSYEEFMRRIQTKPVAKQAPAKPVAVPKTALGRARQSVANERWGGGESELVGALRAGRADDGADYMRPYSADGVKRIAGGVKAAGERAGRRMEYAGERAAYNLQAEKRRRDAPAFETGDAARDNSIVKTRGQLESEMNDRARQSVAEGFGKELADMVAGGQAAAEKRADNLNLYARASAPTVVGADILGAAAANSQRDPARLQASLAKELEGRMGELLGREDVQERMREEAKSMGVSVEDYMRSAMAPQMRERLMADFDRSELERWMPRSAFEDIVDGIGDSLIGGAMLGATTTMGQRQYRERGAAATASGENPYYKRDGHGVAEGLRGGVGLLTDTAAFGAIGRGVAAVGEKVFGNGVKAAANIANMTRLQRVLNPALLTRGAVEGAANFGVYEGVKGAAGYASTADDVTAGGMAGAALESAAHGAVSGATLGLVGRMLGGLGYNVGLKGTEKGWREIAKEGGKGLGMRGLEVVGEGAAFYAGGNLNAAMSGGETDWSAGNLLNNVIAAGLYKLTSAHTLTGVGRALTGANGVPENGERKGVFRSAAEGAAHAITSAATAPSVKQGGRMFGLNDVEKAQLFGKYSPRYSFLRMERNGGGKVSRKEIEDYYKEVMNDASVSWDAKMKLSAIAFGIVPAERPKSDRMEAGYAQTERGRCRVFNEYAEDGTLLGQRIYDGVRDADDILYGHLLDKEQRRLTDGLRAMMDGGFGRMDLMAGFLGRHGYDFENPESPRNRALMDEMEGRAHGLRLDGRTLQEAWRDYVADKGGLNDVVREVAGKYGVSVEELYDAVCKEPILRTEGEHSMCVDLRKAVDAVAYPDGVPHPEHAMDEGKEIAEERGLGTEQPDDNAVRETLDGLSEAEKAFGEALERDNVLKEEYERLKGQGLTNPEIYKGLEESGVEPASLEAMAAYMNADAKVQGMVDGTRSKIEENVSRRVADWCYHGTMDGEKRDGDRMVRVTDSNGRTLLIGAGDVAFDAEGRTKDGVGDMLTVLDETTGETDFVSVKEVRLLGTERAEDYAAAYRKALEERNSEGYAMAQEENGEAGKDRGSGDTSDSRETGKSMEIGNAAGKNDSKATEAVVNDGKGGTDNNGNVLNSDGSVYTEKVARVEDIADGDFNEPSRSVELPAVPENVAAALDSNGKPIIIKKNIFEKNLANHPELEPEDGRAILDEALYNPNLVGQTQPKKRPSYKVAVKTGDKNSIVVLDVYEDKKQIEIVGWRRINERGLEKMQRQAEREGGQFLILSPQEGSAAALSALPNGSSSDKGKSSLHPKTQIEESVPRSDSQELTESGNQPLGLGVNSPEPSTGKDSEKSQNEGDNKQTLTFADGTAVPMTKDSKGRETGDYSQMTAAQGAEWLVMQFGDKAEAVADGKVKNAEKKLAKAKKMKVDYSGEDADILEAEAKKQAAVEAANAELAMFSEMKKAVTERKVKATLEGAGDGAESREASLSLSEPGGKSGEGGTKPREASLSLSKPREKFEGGKRIAGNKRVRTLADGTKIKGHYELVEADSLTPSHDATNGYRKSDGFPVNAEGRTMNDRDYEHDKDAQTVTDMIARKYDGQAVDQVPVVTEDGIVVDGNGRTMAGQKAAKEGTDGAYLESLRENAVNYGFSREQVDGMKHPRLVMVSEEPMAYDTATFAKFNRNEKKAQGNTQQAVANSKKLGADEVSAIVAEIEGSGSLDAFFNNPTAINSLLKRLVDKGVIGQNDVAGLREGEDKLSAAGRDFVKNLLLGSVFSEDTIRMMGEDSVLKNKALNGIRAVMDNMKLGDYALREEIDKAMQLMYEARMTGGGVDARLRTPAMFGENAADRYAPISQAIALALDGKAEDFRELMMAYNRNAQHYADATQTEMFGERPTKEEFVNEFLKLRKWKDYETRHSDKEGTGDAGGSEGDKPEARGGEEEKEGVETAKPSEASLSLTEPLAEKGDERSDAEERASAIELLKELSDEELVRFAADIEKNKADYADAEDANDVLAAEIERRGMTEERFVKILGSIEGEDRGSGDSSGYRETGNNREEESGETAGDGVREQKASEAQAKADKREKALRDEVVGTMRKAGLDVSMDAEKGQRVLDEVNGKAKLSAKKRRALETVSVPRDEKHQPTVVSSADGAKILKELDTTKEKYENQSNRTNTFLGDVAKALGAERNGSASEYATFETKNGRIVTIRLANHNATTSNFDHRGESEGISIVVSPKKSEGMTNDGAAHVVEYYYDALKLRRADGKPLADIVRSIKQALYSGEFTDTTGLAERQEVNAEDVARYNKNVRFFRTATADMLHIHYTSAEEVADRVMKDLLDGVDPRKVSASPMEGMEKAAAAWRSERELQKKSGEDARGSEELFVSLQDKKGKEYYDTVTELARRVKQGTARLVREGEKVESDRGRHGAESVPAVAGKILNAAYSESNGQSGEISGGASGEQGKTGLPFDAVYERIEKWAKGNNAYFSESDIERDSYDGKPWNTDGFESVVYRSKDGKHVIKVTPMGTVLADPISYYIDRNKYFNAVFPDSAIEIIGYGRDKNGQPSIITRQPIFEGETVGEHFNGDTKKSLAYIDAYLKSIGLGERPKRPIEKDLDLDADGGNDKYAVFDVNPGNVIIDKNGKNHVIDAEVLPLDYSETDAVRITDAASASPLEGMERAAAKYREEPEETPRFQKVEDKDELEKLDKEKTFRMYSTLQMVDGVYASPMAGYEGENKKSLKLTNTVEPHKWYRSDEIKMDFSDEQLRQMDELDKGNKPGKIVLAPNKLIYEKSSKGALKFKLQKTRDESIWANYNPYNHTSTSMMNDQFTGAYGRSVDGNVLVTVEWEIPESEKTSGYWAEKAHDPVGFRPWHSGVVNQLLPEERQRSVMLSRYRKMVRAIPFAEVAKSIAAQLKGSGLAIPWNTLPKQLLEEVAKLGVPITTVPAGKSVKQKYVDAFNEQRAEIEKKYPQARFVDVEMTKDAYKDWGKNGGTHYRVEEDLEDVNRKFNERLDSLTKDPTQKGRELQLGRPGDFLRDAGLGDSEIVLDYDRLVRKASEKYRNSHPFSIDDIKDLPKAINSPIAVFDNTNGESRGKVILTEIEKDGKNFIVAVRASERRQKGGVVLEVNEIRTLFPKESRGIVNWLNTDKASNINKEKALAWLGALRTHRGTELTEQELSDAAKVVNDFDIAKQKQVNYRIGGEESGRPRWASLGLSKPLDKNGGGNSSNASAQERIVSAVEKAAKKTGAKVNVVRSVDEIKDEGVRRDIESGKKVTGWYDEKTGEVHLYLPNVKDSYTAEKTVWHETVGHKGMRGLLGDKMDDYMRGLWMDLDNPVNGELRAFVKERMAREPLSVYDAIEEYLAGAAEEGHGEYGFWNNVRNRVAAALREVGYRVWPNVKDVKYMLWLAKNVQKHGGDAVWKMRADAVRWKIERETAEAVKEHGGELYPNDGQSHDFGGMSREEWEEATDGRIHYRTSPSGATALDRYHRMLDEHGYMATEAFADSMASVERLMKAVDPSIRKTEDVPMSMNPYAMATLSVSAASDRMRLFEVQVMKPLTEAMGHLVDAFEGESVEDKVRNMNLYMIKKHGLERNREFFVRDTIKALESGKAKDEKDGDAGVDRGFGDSSDYRDSSDSRETGNVAETGNAAEIMRERWKNEKEYYRERLRKGEIGFAEYLDGLDKNIRSFVDKDYKPGEHDYSGMHGLQKIADLDGAYDDAQAVADVTAAEASMEGLRTGSVKDFWEKVKRATQFSMDEDYRNGLVDKRTYERVSDMFDWYVPLRQYDEKTAEDVYGYMTQAYSQKAAIGPTLMKAKGRKSLSNVELLAQIGVMGNRAIKTGSENRWRQTFARFVRNSGEQNLVREVNVWQEKTGTDNDGKAMWREAHPDLPENATADEVAAVLDAFEKNMKEKQAKGEALNITRGDGTGLRFERVQDKSQHFVDVMIGGRKHRFAVMGNPRAAQAMNGMLKDSGARIRTLKTVTRFMAQLATSWSPEFVLRNVMRDAEFVSSNLASKEGMRYAGVWAKYYAELSPLNVALDKKTKARDMKGSLGWGMYARYREGTLGDSKMERLFREYMENGGETGWVQLKGMDEMEKEYKAVIGDMHRGKAYRMTLGAAQKVLTGFFDDVESVNEVAENMARFATFCASRDMGRSAARAAYDAKEVATNFNRKGSGDAIKSFRNGDEGAWKNRRKNAYGLMSGYMQNYSMFFNAGMQSANLLAKNWKGAAASTAVKMAAAPFALGILAAVVNNWRVKGEDVKKRGGVKDPYGELPEYIRRNNLCLYAGGGKFVTIPLAIELRAFYGLGDLAAGQTFAGNVKSERNMAMDAVGCMSQLLPAMDYMNSAQTDKHPLLETVKALTPTAASPLLEWWTNSDWKGAPIRRVNDSSENVPAWKNAYANTPEGLVELNKWVNAKTNDIAPGDANMKGSDWADALTDPSMLNHVMGTLGGGALTFGARGFGLVRRMADGKTEEVELNDVPWVRSLVYAPTEKSAMARTKARWYDYKEKLEKDMANYDALGRKNVPLTEYIKNTAEREKIDNSPKGEQINIVKDFEKEIRKMNKQRAKCAGDRTATDKLDKDIEMKMQEAVEKLDNVGKK